MSAALRNPCWPGEFPQRDQEPLWGQMLASPSPTPRSALSLVFWFISAGSSQPMQACSHKGELMTPARCVAAVVVFKIKISEWFQVSKIVENMISPHPVSL